MENSNSLSLFYISAPKVVRFESKQIASFSLIVKLSLAIVSIYLMCQRSSYQIFDRSPISAVTIQVKLSSKCSTGNDSLLNSRFASDCPQSRYDVNDFILPAIENSAVTIITRIIETEYVLRPCERNASVLKASSTLNALKHDCKIAARCILPPRYRFEFDNRTHVDKVPLCWYRTPISHIKINEQILNYVLFIRHFVEFPLLHLVRNNVERDLFDQNYLENCEYDEKQHPLCPKFRIRKIFELIEGNPDEYTRMFYYGSLIEIKINWKCNLDRRLEYCEPQYAFKRLDITPYEDDPYEPGSSFFTSKHFFASNDRELRRIYTKIYNLHIVVSITGEVGKFDLFQTTTNIGSFVAIFSTGKIVCDLVAAFFTNFKSVKYDIS